MNGDKASCVSNPHIATLTSLQLEPDSPLPPFKPRLKIEKANWQKFSDLTNVPIDNPIFKVTGGPLENICSEFTEAVHDIISDTIPSTKQHDRIPASEQWWFGEKSRKAKQELHEAVKSNREKLPGSRANLRQMRAKVLEVFRQEKHEKWNSICQSLNLTSSLGSHWRRLRWLYNGGTPPQPALLQYAKAKEMADEAMSLFSERSQAYNLRYVTRAVLDRLQKDRESEIETAITSNSKLCSDPFTLKELNAVLVPFKTSSPGEDNIPYIVLANLGIEFRKHLVHLVNTSFQLHRSPLQWKTVPIIPVPKKEKGQYRPIALLSCIDKVMEKMMLNRLSYIVGPLHPNLMGCTQGKGTTDAVASLGNIVSDAKYKRSGPKTNALTKAFAIFIDYEKAFELANSTVISHTLVRDKGVNGNMLGWLKDYLTERKGYTTVLGQKSEIMSLYQVIPQGSVLSLYLFNILMDKLLRTIDTQLPEFAKTQITIISYADDIVITSNHFYAKHILSLALDILQNTSTFLGLQINTAKTKAMAWNHSQKFPEFQFQVYNAPIEWVRTFKYLGVTFDDTLSFREHVDDVVNRATKRINILKHMASSPYGATQKKLLQYFKSCIRPILEYGSVVLCVACPSALNRLESVQNTALKIALRLPKHAKSDMVRIEAGCPSLNDRLDSLAVVAYTKFKANELTHPYFQNGKEMHMDPFLLGKQSIHPRDIPLDMFLKNLSESIGLPKLSSIPKSINHPLESHISSLINFEFTNLETSKHLLTSEEMKSIVKVIENDIETRYSDHNQIYVDGSVDPESGQAAAAYSFHSINPPKDLGVRITDNVSSTQAELSAIHLTLLEIQTSCLTPSKTVILCDSQAAIKTMQRSNPDPLDQLTDDIFKTFTSLSLYPNFKLTLHWIPSHVGIPGNERADSIAAKARDTQEIGYHVPASLGQCKSLIKKFFENKEKERFGSSNHQSNQRYLKFNPLLKKPKLIHPDPVTQFWFNRLRMDVDRYCFLHSYEVVCGYCESKFSAQHYLTVCPVSSHMTFSQLLRESEHSLSLEKQEMAILNRASCQASIDIFSKYLMKTPPKLFCPHVQHGKITFNKSWVP